MVSFITKQIWVAKALVGEVSLLLAVETGWFSSWYKGILLSWLGAVSGPVT